jgi:phosphoglycolate phosphatase
MHQTSDMLVVFDLDGTLVDSTRALLESHEVAWASLGLQRPPDAAILELIGLPLLHTMRTLAPDQDPEALAEAYSRAYVKMANRYERLFDGMAELMARPFRAAVATGKSQRGAERAVNQHGLGDRFEIVLGADSVPRPKPNPDLLHAIMEATGTKNLVMIGDTTYDLEMAHAAGVKAIGVSWGHHSVERLRKWAPVVDSVKALGHLLQR